MGEPPSSHPDARRLLEEDRRSGRNYITGNLLGYCFKRTRDRDRAQDAMQEALARVLAGEGWHRWEHDESKTPERSLLDHLCDLAKDVLWKEHERAAQWREVPARPVHEATAADPQGRTDERMADHAGHDDDMRRAQRVLDRLDDRTREMLRLEQEGVDDCADLAARLGCTVREVYRMRERVAHHRDRVLDEQRREDEKP
jgi:DNA-directed RNA polymerase specialized sigma24 family protein